MSGDEEAAASARGPFAPEPEPPSASEEAARVLRRGSAGRFLLRAALGLGIAGASIGGGYLGYRAMVRREALDVSMVRFEGGIAAIGNDLWPEESPAHEVTLAPYRLDATEVTVRAYTACVDDGVCTAAITGGHCNYGVSDRALHPINCVTFDQAAAYCRWAKKRLPTEKEWEHAARLHYDAKAEKGKTDLFPWGAGAPTKQRANVCGTECAAYFKRHGKTLPPMFDDDDGFPLTAPVGSFRDGATPEGLFDMAGNVWEWTSSPYCAYPDERCGHDREMVVRGGGFETHQPRTLEATSREALGRSEATETTGLRCAKDG